jgi:hypothetical protein
MCRPGAEAQDGFFGLCIQQVQSGGLTRADSLVLSSAFGHPAQVLFFECPLGSPDVNREAVGFNGLAHRLVAKDGILLDGEKVLT